MSGYAVSSALRESAEGTRLDLATARGATPQGRLDHPVFFTGFLARPDVAAAGLLAVADVAASRYADAGLMRRIASLDPVVTASGDRLRFESFSGCNSVYARLDLLPDALGSGEVGHGTTNVDINLPLRTALARVGRAEALHLSVGHEELRAATLASTHVERKVRLPDRWVRGLAEVPSATRTMAQAATLTAGAFTRLLRELPRREAPGPTLFAAPLGPRWVISAHPAPGSIPIVGTTRVRGLERLARHTRSVAVHVAGSGATAWVADLGDSRFTLVVSPDPYRGFSGEGSLLTLLGDDRAEPAGRLLAGELGWSPTIDAELLRRRTGLAAEEVEAGLGWLCASGRLGHDLTEGRWFHRELPIDAEKVLRRNPRLVSARALVEDGAVRRVDGGWRVRGSRGDEYAVDPDLRCTCPWEREHHGTRGPCKHVLAVRILQLAVHDTRGGEFDAAGGRLAASED